MSADRGRRADRGRLLVVSGPSGVGKSTVVRALLVRAPQAWLSVSATTRPARPGEVDGVDYFFVDSSGFDAMIEGGELLEWAEFAGNRYGTPRGPVEEHRIAGRPVILEIEVAGARQVRRAVDDALLVFLAPPSWEVLRARLLGRGTETDEAVTRRLEAARLELAAKEEFDVVVVNTEVPDTVETLVGFLS